MPRRKTNTKRPKRKRQTKLRRYRSLPLGGVPDKMLVRLRYVQQVTLNPGVGGIAYNAFRANSLFDPDKTGVGHQPSNFDWLKQMYDRYTVIGAKCTTYHVALATGDSIPGTMALCLSEDGDKLSGSHAVGGIQGVLEQPKLRASWKTVGIHDGSDTKLVRYFSAKKFFGVKDVVGIRPYTADTASNPAQEAFFEVGLMSSDDSNDPGSMNFNVEIEYLAVMSSPLEQTYS